MNDVDRETTIEQRLTATENSVEAHDRDLKSLWFFIIGIVLAVVITGVASAFWPTPQPTNRDATESELLSKGAHCYDSGEERAAARQRALAAIDRMQWERDHLITQYDQDSPILAAPSPPQPSSIPSVRDTTPTTPLAGWDENLCFSIE